MKNLIKISTQEGGDATKKWGQSEKFFSLQLNFFDLYNLRSDNIPPYIYIYIYIYI